MTVSRLIERSSIAESARGRLLLMLLLAPCMVQASEQALEPVPKDFKVAIFGDQGLGADAEAVLKLVKAEGASLVVQLGDFDYEDSPAKWEAQTNKILGPDFPQLAVMGNHDSLKWGGTGGYGALIKARMDKMGIKAVGDIGRKCAFTYKGIFFLQVTPGLYGSGHDAFIKQQLAQDSSMWRISTWHYNMTAMQLGTKPNRTGWPVYEESRLGGAIIATAHDHQYARSHLLSSMTSQTVTSKDTAMKLSKGKSFVILSGLGGAGMYEHEISGAWWASMYSSETFGTLFATFNVGGQENRASFYFKNINGKIIDKFEVISEVNQAPVPIRVGRGRIAVDPKSWSTSAGGGLQVADIMGRRLPSGARSGDASGLEVRPGRNGIFFIHAPGTGKAPRKIALLD